MNGIKISQSFNGTYSVICDRKLSNQEINYFEFQINSLNPMNEWM